MSSPSSNNTNYNLTDSSNPLNNASNSLIKKKASKQDTESSQLLNLMNKYSQYLADFNSTSDQNRKKVNNANNDNNDNNNTPLTYSEFIDSITIKTYEIEKYNSQNIASIINKAKSSTYEFNNALINHDIEYKKYTSKLSDIDKEIEALQNLQNLKISNNLTNLREECINKILSPKADLLIPLTIDENKEVDKALRTSDYYHTLRAGQWLNDQMINDQIDILITKFPNNHYFNSFFYTKLMSKTGGVEGPYCFKNVSRWTKRLPKSLFDYESVFLPVHVGTSHWCMAEIRMSEKKILYYDSLRGHDNGCLKNLIQYLNDESLDKLKCPFDSQHWETSSIKSTPRQRNGFDCGVFSCKTAEFLSHKIPLTFTQEDMPYFRRRIILDILKFKKDNPS